MRHSLFALLLIFSLSAVAQDDSQDRNRERMSRFLNKLNEEKKTPTDAAPPVRRVKEGDDLFRDTDSIRINVKSFPDVSRYYAEYYTNVVNKYGFWQGAGVRLTKDDLRHVPRYFKLMRPAGLPSTAPFTHMQVLDPWGKCDNNSCGPILANPFGSDKDISSSWSWKLKTICQFEKIYRDGTILQENMYDSDGNLVLQYFPTSVSKNQIIGYYTDAYGVLAHLRKDEDCTHVGITLDDNGYECQIAFMDEEGMLKRNGDDAFIQLWTRDEKGNILRTMSADAVGRPIIDNWGNCGWETTYYPNGLTKTATCINQYGRPQRMSKKRDESVEDKVRARYEYDRWGNLTSSRFYDEDWRPDTITGGIHVFKYQRTLYGDITLMRSEGLDGRLAAAEGGDATWRQQLDGNGRLLDMRSFGADSLLSRNGNCITRARYVDGVRVWEERFTSPDGVDTVLSYRYVRTPLLDTTYNASEGVINIERYDSRRRLVSDEYYDLEMQPIRRSTYHKNTTTYTDEPGLRVREERYFDADGQLMPLDAEDYWRDYNVNIFTRDLAHRRYADREYDGDRLLKSVEVDSVARLRITATYQDGRVLDRFGNKLSEDCSQMEGLIYFDSLGCRGRTCKADALYYEARRMVNVQGNNTSWSCINEFGEPSYMMTGDWSSAPIYCVNVLGDPYYYDEHGDSIPSSTEDRQKFKDKLYKSFCIELTDSLAYRCGLRTGDLLVRYGDWHYPAPSIYGGYHENVLCRETVLKATVPKTVVVMRHDPQTRTSRLLQLQLPEGTPAQIGFLYHMTYMTTRERERYVAAVAEGRAGVELEQTSTDLDANTSLHFIKPHKVGTTKNKAVFIGGFKQNAIILAWEAYVDGRSYFFRFNDPVLKLDDVFEHAYDSIVLHYTVDARTAERYTFYDDDFRYNVNRANTQFPEVDVFAALADSLQQVFDAAHPVAPVVLKPHELARQLLAIDEGVTEEQGDGSTWRGSGKYKFGDVSHSHTIRYDLSEMGYSEMFRVRNMLMNIDYSDYVLGLSDDDLNYLLPKKGRFTEVFWRGNSALVFLSGDVMMSDMKTVVFDVVADGLMRQRGLEGRFVVLECNDWKFGMSNQELKAALQGDKHGVRKIKLAEVQGEGDAMRLGPTRTYRFGPGLLGVHHGFELLPQSLFLEALRRSGR